MDGFCCQIQDCFPFCNILVGKYTFSVGVLPGRFFFFFWYYSQLKTAICKRLKFGALKIWIIHLSGLEWKRETFVTTLNYGATAGKCAFIVIFFSIHLPTKLCFHIYISIWICSPFLLENKGMRSCQEPTKEAATSPKSADTGLESRQMKTGSLLCLRSQPFVFLGNSGEEYCVVGSVQ